MLMCPHVHIGVDEGILSESRNEVVHLLFPFDPGRVSASSYVMIVLKGSVPMSFGGNEQPAAYGELVSIGGLNPDVNKKLSGAIATILETKLSVPKSRFFLKFYDTKASPSESRVCTVFTCFTPELEIMDPTLDGMAPLSKLPSSISS
ncbi:Macrophage migration inhibitory factor isogeny [Cucumis melo var. makuwa]|uniref:Macrophage migration inhibitory factor isogeny n=1 Tax=Cucumis melo var. makuwa TaxID=1194695 RepID=A0A5A7T7Z8_CUCMM|nr:Macrophage migration inhibitory factor isogeny [Cucumis melo var. makuwa]